MSNAYTRTFVTLALALATFSGQLIDQTTGQPLVHVHVRAHGPSRAAATSDANGRFTLKDLRPGAYVVDVESNDVPEQSFHVRVAGRITARTFKACSTTLDYHCGTPNLPGGGG